MGMLDLVMFCLVLLYYSEECGFYFESMVRSVICPSSPYGEVCDLSSEFDLSK